MKGSRMTTPQDEPRLFIRRASQRVMNLGTLATQAAMRRPDHPALLWNGQQRTWAEFNARADAIAHHLVKQGAQRGDRVMIHTPNCPEMLEAMIAVLKTGAVMVPTNFRLAAHDIADMALRTRVKAIIGHAAYLEHIKKVEQMCPTCASRIVIQGDGDEGYETIVARNIGEKFIAADVIHDDPCWFFFTSGTTGKPKIATLTHGQMGFIAVNHAADLMPGLDERDVSLAVAPLSHGAGAHFFPNMARCVPTVLATALSFDPAEIWRLIEKHRVTNMFTVPTIVKRLSEHQAVDQYDHSSLKHVIYAGAPMYRQDQKQALAKMGNVLVQYFGLGEVTGCITVLPADEHSLEDDEMPVGSCGYARTGIDIAILDDRGARLNPHETGNICVSGVGVFAGYFENEQANAESFIDGWFMTGDLGHLDERGYLYITGRRSDMYICGGSNVYPREAEEKLLEHPAIAEIAIVGIPDKDWGEVGAAIITLKEGESLDIAALKHWMQDKVTRYKQPRDFYIWEEIPKSGYGKIEKKRIRAILQEQGLIDAISDT